MKRKWTEKEIIFLKNNFKILSLSDLSIKMDRTKSSIYHKCVEYGLILNHHWSLEEDEILYKYYGKLNYDKYIHLLNNRSVESIRNRAHDLKIKSEKYFISNYKYDVNHYFFKDINILNSYWAGFIAADGTIFKGCDGFSIKLSQKDKNQIEKFKNDIQSNSPIENGTSMRNETVCHYSKISIYSQNIIQDLNKNFNLTPLKSFTLQSPNINNFDCQISFIAGLIDGDGSITLRKDKYLIIKILGTENIVTWCKNILNGFLDIYNVRILEDRNLYFIIISDNNKSKKFINYVKNLNLPLLGRKWNKI